MHWFDRPRRIPGVPAKVSTGLLIITGLVLDSVGAVRWVARHEVVVVPGTGPLESTVLVRPWQTPWVLFVTTLAGRLFGVRVCYVCVGATAPRDVLTRWLLRGATRLAAYRSFRDEASREAVARLGVDTTGDPVFPDLVWSLSVPQERVAVDGDESRDSQRVIGLGVMAFTPPPGVPTVEGGEEALVQAWGGLARRLVEDGNSVRLFYGDDHDRHVAERIQAVVASPVVSLAVLRDPAALMQELVAMDAVVATRFHNVLCALMCGRSTISLGYGRKHHDLMAAAGYPDRALDLQDLLTGRLDNLLPRLGVDDPSVGPHLDQVRREMREALEPQLASMVRLVVAGTAEAGLAAGVVL
jgi:polysaccharide pyruvyl transferase WcaK-like protein